MALVVTGIAAFSGVTAATAHAGDGIPDVTQAVGTLENCQTLGRLAVSGGNFTGYACWKDGSGMWYMDLDR
ncbi:hypothetical protein [Streptomyces sp. NRRL S-813]|uniref:hypothetical protein n=1 Tax=Streptomyces sp. NRRL S-813 TaxID=1463919 RepID=UPI000B2A7956|nr:hypothetical protein [Streptomyces sp. NRRL S-813]